MDVNMQISLKPTIFYGLTFGQALALALCVGWLGETVLLLTMLTPLTSGLLMLLWISPEGGARRIPSLLGIASAGLKGWPLAILAPYSIQILGIAALSLWGLAVFVSPEGGFGADFALNAVAELVVGSVFALSEEVGWRGYLLPRVSTGLGAVQAMLLVGFLHGAWHLPLILGTPFYHPDASPFVIVPLFMITLTLAGVFYGFLRVWTGSIWPVAIAHGAANGAWDLFEQTNTTRTPLVLEFLGGESGLIVILSLVVITLILVAVMRRPGFVSRMARVA
jgi:membrane protease YdiL (CAAX protease family)